MAAEQPGRRPDPELASACGWSPVAADWDVCGPPLSEEGSDEDEPADRALPEDPETCLQLNMVYQEVVREKLAEVGRLLAQNREQQEEISWLLAGSKGPKVKDAKGLPQNVYIGHFMKPYFKDKVTGVGPPANEDTREKATQGIKTFEQLLVTKWKSWEKALLRKSVVSDRLQRLLQPKLLKLEYLRQKQGRVCSEAERQALEQQAREAERDVERINQLPEEALLGSRLDSHDWEKIANVTFEGSRSAEEIRKFWQNSEHPSINKQEWGAEELERLRAIAASHGHLRWQAVAEELGTGRSAFQCLQKFQQQSKDLKRREWTPEEDRMLTQLVQEMRVGSHIPYRRIVYYMEGRDSMQLIYRWTKSLDPSLKKGSWAPEEDAKLLQAVAKHREQNWFRVREEVPGRSDAQCRDRYLRRLHFSLKKGRWDPKEEEQLLELIAKYGVGRWAKIAAELPHRSGSQCLSKWKGLAERRPHLRRQQRRRPQRRSTRWSSSSSDSDPGSQGSGDSSSSSEDTEPEPEESWRRGQAPPSPQHVVPDMDLWVPARQSPSQPRGAGVRTWTQQPVAGGATADRREAPAVASAPAAPRQAQTPSGSELSPRTGDPRPASPEESACQGGKQLPEGPLETVLGVPRPEAAWSSRLKEKLRRPPLPSSALGPRLGTFRNGHRRQRPSLQRRLLKRRLLLAVSPWVGPAPLPSPQAAHTRADGIRTRLKDVQLPSRPVFTLFIQLFQIDTAGCMKVVEERKAQPPALAQVGPQSLSHLPQAPSKAQRAPGCLFPSPPPPAAKATNHRQDARPRRALCSPCGPRPKPKTVSELLREKHLREARARKAAQTPAVLPTQLLLSPLILQPSLLPTPDGSTPTPSPGLAASPHTLGERTLLLPAPPLPLAGSLPTAAQKQGLAAAPQFLSVLQGPALLPGQPLTWLLTAPGLLPVPVPPLADIPQPTRAPQPPALPETPACSGQPPATVNGGPAPASKTDPLPTPPLAFSAAEAGGGVPAPGETSVPRAPLQAGHPDTMCPEPSQLPAPSDPGGPSEPEKPPPPCLGPEKGALDLDLLSREDEGTVQAWLKGQHGVHVSPLQSRLPYQPPTLCGLRVLARLLLQKKGLESQAASLAAGPGALQAALQLAREQLQDNPAYLLLKARFLAMLTLPALLATLPPPGVPTTLSALGTGSESEDEALGDLHLCQEDRGLPGPPATSLSQGVLAAGPGAAPTCPGAVDDLNVLRTRRSWHPRKQR
ncbi:snRNA-activating protein complex subunit 4 [Ochotona curzoniae]|uniref:snRNA-activating protein complex subunit 4 n=1 Tax=Ochotona curzoniae TaxID=130825 RepID=UPI001B35416C|nr:snRNA-activating protein complex subunit 4 [Ochotona curzoniae]